MLRIGTYIAESKIEGVGVFAGEAVAKGALVWRFDSNFDRLVPISFYNSAPIYLKQLMERYAYPSPGGPGLLVYETDNGRFMNHSENPNTDFSVSGGGWAIADIKAGEELTCNYAQFYEDFDSASTFDVARQPDLRRAIRLPFVPPG